jgi:hypothetical protein
MECVKICPKCGNPLLEDFRYQRYCVNAECGYEEINWERIDKWDSEHETMGEGE